MDACTQMSWADVANTVVVCAAAIVFWWLFFRYMMGTEPATPDYPPPTRKTSWPWPKQQEREDQRSDRINRASRRAAAQQKEQTK